MRYVAVILVLLLFVVSIHSAPVDLISGGSGSAVATNQNPWIVVNSFTAAKTTPTVKQRSYTVVLALNAADANYAIVHLDHTANIVILRQNTTAASDTTAYDVFVSRQRSPFVRISTVTFTSGATATSLQVSDFNSVATHYYLADGVSNANAAWLFTPTTYSNTGYDAEWACDLSGVTDILIVPTTLTHACKLEATAF